MLFADIIFIIVDLSMQHVEVEEQAATQVAFQILDLLFSAFFCIEVSIRIIGLG